MSEERMSETWILGSTGRVGRALADRLSQQSRAGVVLVGRSADALRRIAEQSDAEVRVLVLGDLDAMVKAVRRERPRVVVNLLGSYADNAPALARACMPGGAYVDLAVDLATIETLVGMNHEASRERSIIVSGAGFGVLGTEAVVAHLCKGRPRPAKVQVDALGSFAAEDGVMGEAFAQTSVDVITTGGLRYRNGELVPVSLASNLQRLTLPDGTTVASAAVPSGELFAAHAMSGAPDVDFSSALAPTTLVVRAMLPAMSRLLRIPAMHRMMVRQLASSKTKSSPRPRPHSWGHAVVTWQDGTVREGWLRAGDAMEYTADILAAVTSKLTRDDVPHGAFTPAAAFGAQIAVDAGGTLIDALPPGSSRE